MKYLSYYLRPLWPKIILAACLMTLSAVASLLLPALMSQVVNQGIYGRDFSFILACCLKMLIISLVGTAGAIVGVRLSSQVTSRFSAALSQGVFSKVMRMESAAFGKMDTGSLVSRTTQDIGHLAWVTEMLSNSIISVPVMFLGSVILSFQKDPVLAAIVLSAVPLVFLAVILVSRKIPPLHKKSNEYIDRQNELMRQRLRGIRVIRAFRREPDEQEKIADATRIMAENIIKANVSMGMLTPFSMFLLNAATVMLLYVGAARMVSGASAATGGDILAMIQYIGILSGSIMNAAMVVVMVPQAAVSLRRILQIMDFPEESTQGRREQKLTGGIRLENLTFSFAKEAKPAVQDVSLEIAPGQRIAIIGSTGSGKSALVQLLLGFRQPDSGKIYFDGTESSLLSEGCIRDQISCVLQKTAIFTGTIRENVAMGRADASENEIWAALNDAQLGDFVRGLPNGLDYKLELSGTNLSGGQRQRLAISRALLKIAPIYIFDDSFSALDFLTESRLRARLLTRLKGKTQITVTQRVTTARNADCIFVMDQGRLIDHGPHEALLSRCQVYREIYTSQTGGGEG